VPDVSIESVVAEFSPGSRVRYLDPEREMKNPESFSLRLFDALSPMIAVRPSARA